MLNRLFNLDSFLPPSLGKDQPKLDFPSKLAVVCPDRHLR